MSPGSRAARRTTRRHRRKQAPEPAPRVAGGVGCGRDIVVGGTDAEGEWGIDPDPAVAAAILARATALVPELADAEVLGHVVGLRPARPEVRLEVDRVSSGGSVVHCYGHDGAGVTVSWGCADEVVTLVDGMETEGR